MLQGFTPGNDPHRKYLADQFGLVLIVDERRRYRPQFFCTDSEPREYIRLLSRDAHWRVKR